MHAPFFLKIIQNLNLLLIFLTFSQFSGSLNAQIVSSYPFTESEVIHFRPITTHPEADFAGAVSPDGKWLAFTSRRSGNLDIWIKSTGGGFASQITVHKADDYNPDWSANGKQLVFTSVREDAAGDIWSINLLIDDDQVTPKDQPQKITNHFGLDDFAKFSPTQNRLVFVSDRDGTENIWFYDFTEKKFEQVTFSGGTHPAWSPDGRWLAFTAFVQGTGSHIYLIRPYMTQMDPNAATRAFPITSGPVWDGFPNWSSKGYSIVFSRIGLDLNQDGLVTPTDPAALWKIDLDSILIKIFNTELSKIPQIFTDNPPPLFQLMPWGKNQILPAGGANHQIYFTSYIIEKSDLFQISESGIFAKDSTGERQLLSGRSRFAFPAPGVSFTEMYAAQNSGQQLVFTQEQREALFERILALQRVIDYFPTERNAVAWANYEMGRTFRALGFYASSIKYLNEVIDDFSDIEEASAFAEIERVESRASEFGDEFVAERKTDFITELELFERIYQKYQHLPRPAVRLEIIMADILAEVGEQGKALRRYEQILQKYQQFPADCAETQWKISNLYSKYDQGEAVQRSNLKIIQNYPTEKKWIDKALESIFAFEKNQVRPAELILTYRDLITSYQTIPVVAAAAQLQIGKTLYNNGNYKQAIDELTLVETDYPELTDFAAQAKLLMSAAYLKQSEDLKAITSYERVIREHQSDANGSYAQTATRELMGMLLETGERFFQLKELQLALTRFSRARQIQPRSIHAHRGVISCLYWMKRINEAISYYRVAVKNAPENEILLYSLGLCYAYKGTEKAELYGKKLFDISDLKKSNQIIENALSLNHRLIEAYLTLSVNYELIERQETEARNKPNPWYIRSLNSITAPIKTLYRIALRIREKSPTRWYEGAIDLLNTAKALNDERQNPELESLLAFNLATNYYKLGEFGYPWAYENYLTRLRFDTTFQNNQIKAQTYSRLGHCAFVVGNYPNGTKYLSHAIKLYSDAGDTNQMVGNMKRLALLYQIDNNQENAIELLKKIVALQRSRTKLSEPVRLADLQILYRQIAYNYDNLGDEEELSNYIDKSLSCLNHKNYKKVKTDANWIKLGILGWEFPVYNVGKLVTGSSTAYSGFTTPEEFALLYSLQENSHIRQNEIEAAIEFHKKKLLIYNKIGNISAEAIILNNIAYLYYKIGNFAESWNYFSQSLKICHNNLLFIGALTNIINLTTLTIEINHPERRPAGTPAFDPLLKSTSAFGSIETAMQYINQGLRYYMREDVLLDPKYKMILLNIMGNLHHVKAQQFLRPEDPIPIHERPDDWLMVLEEKMLADSCYKLGIRVDTFDEYPLQIAVLRHNRALTYFSIQEYEKAYTQTKLSLGLCQRFLYKNLEWQVHLLMAKILWAMGPDKQQELGENYPSFFFDMALEIMQTHILANELGALSSSQIQVIRSAYEDAIYYYSSIGLPENALYLAESFKNHSFLISLSQKKVDLKIMYDTNFRNDAFSYQDTLLSLQNLIQKEKLKILYADTARVSRLEKEVRMLESQYAELLQDNSDHELESLVRVNPIAPQEIQRVLTSDMAAVYYFTGIDSLYIWIVTHDNLAFQKYSVKRDEIRHLATQFYAGIGNETVLVPIIQNLNQLLLQPVWEQIKEKEEIIFIPDDYLFLIPFNLCLYFQNNQNMQQTVLTAPSLSNYYYCAEKRKLSGNHLLFMHDLTTESFLADLKNTSYIPIQLEPSAMKESWHNQLTPANIIHIKSRTAWNNIDPGLSQYSLTASQQQEFQFNSLDILSWRLKCYLVVFNHDSSHIGPITANLPLAFKQQSLFYAGTSTILSNLWPIRPDIRTKFYQYFYQNLTTQKPGAAFKLAISQLIQDEPGNLDWAAFQLSGYGGMSQPEEREYATFAFEKRVQLANLTAFNEKNWADAINYYEDAIQMAIATDDTTSLLNLYSLIIDVANAGEIYSKAIEYTRRQLEYAQSQQDTAAIRDIYYSLMVFHTEDKQYAKAIEYQQKYVALATEKIQIAHSNYYLGQLYENSADYKLAIDAYSTAISQFEEMGDPIKAGLVLLNLGRVYLLYVQNYPAALSTQIKALKIFQDEGDDVNMLSAMQNIGLCYENMSNFPDAQKYQEQSLKLSRQLADSLKAGISLYNLANIYWKTGDYQNSLNSIREAITLFTELSNRQLLSLALSTQGLVLMSLGQLKEALQAEEKARDLAAEINIPRDLSATYQNLGLIFKQLKNWDQALDNFRQALKLDSTYSNRQGLTSAHRNLAMIYIDQQKFELARKNLEIALKYAHEINDKKNETQCFYEYARLYATTNQADSALIYTAKTIQQAEYYLFPEVTWRAHRLEAKIWQGKKKSEQSIAALQKAVAIIENMRSRIKVEDYKSGFIDDKQEVYHDLISVLAENTQPIQAFDMSEQARSRNFADLLANRNFSISRGANSSLAANRDSLIQKINSLQGEIASLRAKKEELNIPERTRLTQLERELGLQKEAFQTISIMLQENDPEMADLINAYPKRASDIMPMLGDSVCLVEYYLMPENIFIWFLDSRKIELKIEKFPLDSLGNLTFSLRKHLTERLEVEAMCKELYRHLIKPVEDNLNNFKHIIIVPYGLLHYLPFATLMDSKSQYLIDKHTFSLAPSATVLAYCLEKGEKYQAKNSWQPSILALGNPDLGDPNLNLTFAEHEIKSLMRTYPNRVKAFLEQDASESIFKAYKDDANMFLFSCHGEYDEKNPLFSTLLLAPDKQNNGRLEAHEIFGIELNSYLVVMSACETGLGTITGGDEVIGLSRSFIFAGTTSLMSSLWKVDDLATAVLIKRFFRYLKEGESRSEALRKAQLLVRQEIYSHPAYWAAFNITGDFR